MVYKIKHWVPDWFVRALIRRWGADGLTRFILHNEYEGRAVRAEKQLDLVTRALLELKKAHPKDTEVADLYFYARELSHSIHAPPSPEDNGKDLTLS